MALHTDSGDYHLLTDGVKLIKDVPGMTCEIGLRAGGGSALIMRQLLIEDQAYRTHIAIDPYGNIEYESHEGLVERLDYTNDMRDQCMIDMYTFAKAAKLNFLFFPLEDTEFFKRYPDGIPIYKDFKNLETQYALVHFDGPHAWAPLVDELVFFANRAPSGAIFVFDDVSFYDHEKFEKEEILPRGFELVTKTRIKASYRKI